MHDPIRFLWTDYVHFGSVCLCVCFFFLYFISNFFTLFDFFSLSHSFQLFYPRMRSAKGINCLTSVHKDCDWSLFFSRSFVHSYLPVNEGTRDKLIKTHRKMYFMINKTRKECRKCMKKLILLDLILFGLTWSVELIQLKVQFKSSDVS